MCYELKYLHMIERFCREKMWSPSVEITEQELSRWQQFLVDGDILDAPLPYEKIVKSGPYHYALAQLKQASV
ncbi:MAG: hypothetical protein ACRC5A_05735 [Enterobacteriaceae bacterium]